ncbi:MAG TPA: class I SAM-dependent methyltransferase [Gammaproteobacteria bacterium]|nr:class I SAM-dependent methyltransferase [Gammaproteobacteria bacterium]
MEMEKLSNIYDKFAESYDNSRDLFDIDEIILNYQGSLKTDKGSLLDPGCGAGVPVARLFVDRGWSVTRVDFSPKMLSLANKHIPAMKTICSDICTAVFDDGEFNAITLIYSMFHIPKNQHGALFDKLYRWLTPNGKILFTYAAKDIQEAKSLTDIKSS